MMDSPLMGLASTGASESQESQTRSWMIQDQRKTDRGQYPIIVAAQMNLNRLTTKKKTKKTEERGPPWGVVKAECVASSLFFLFLSLVCHDERKILFKSGKKILKVYFSEITELFIARLLRLQHCVWCI